MRALLLFITLVVVLGEFCLARERSRPLAPPFWQNAAVNSDRLVQCQDPTSDDWVVLDRSDGTVLARGALRGMTFVEAVDNLRRRDRGEQIRFDFIR
jgi:hypothetical protein